MDLYCVMGNPVAHSRSPWIHARFAELTGQPLRYERQLAPLDGFAATVRAFRAGGRARLQRHRALQARGRGPGHRGKASAWRWPAQPTPCSSTARTSAPTTPTAPAWWPTSTRNAGVALAGRDLLLVGAGGAAAGVLGPLLASSPRRVVIANRTVEPCARTDPIGMRRWPRRLASRCSVRAGCSTALADDFDVVINATASSLAGAEVPVSARVLRPGSLAYDMMYGPAAAGFLGWAVSTARRPRDGLGMLVEQAAEAFALWRGVRPPSRQVLAELRALMATPAAH
jgi:shikimate dehydrogenase